MKRSLFSILLLLAAASLLSQPPVLLRNAQYIGWEANHLALPNGTTMVFWNDTSSGSSDVLAQKISSEGLQLWPAPRPLASTPLEDRILCATLSNDNNIVVYYSSYSSAEDGISYWLQKFSQAGQPLWGDQGIAISTEHSLPKTGSLVPNSIGGVYLIYRSTLPSMNIYGVNLDAAGNNLWPHFPLSNYGLTYEVEAVEDGFGGVIINYAYYTSGIGLRYRLIRLDAAGDLVGNDPLVDPTSLAMSEYNIMKDGAGNFLLYGLNWPIGMQMQRMDANGNLLSTLVTVPILNQIYATHHKLCPLPGGGLAYAYIHDIDNDQSAIMVHHLDCNLQETWAQPYQIALAGYTYHMNLNTDNGIWLSWVINQNQPSNYNDAEVFCTRIETDGSPAFAPIALSSETHSKYNPIIRILPSKALVIWNDHSSPHNSLMEQIVSNTGITMLETGGRSVHAVLNGGTESMAIQHLGNNYLHIYEDTRDEWSSHLYYQLTTENGEVLLEENGKLLNPEESSWERYQDSKLSATNTVFILYNSYDQNLGQYSLWLQGISAAGNPIWPGSGICVASSPESGFDGSLLGFVGNDVLVVWPALNPGSYYQSFLGQSYVNGAPQWPAGGKLLVESANNFIYPRAMHGDYLVFQHEDYQAASMSVKALKVGSNGDPAPGWPVNGRTVIPGTTYYAQYLHSGLSNGDLVVFMSYSDQANVRTAVQKLNPAGQSPWGDSGVLLANNEHCFAYMVDDAVYDDTITWIKHLTDDHQVSLNRIDNAGNLLWGDSGCDLNFTSMEWSNLRLTEFANGTFTVIQTRNAANDPSEIIRQDVSDAGELLNPEPITILPNRSFLTNPNLCRDNNAGILSWNEEYYYERGDAIPLRSLWSYRIDAYPVSTDDPHNPAPVSNLANFPNPFRNQTTIRFEIKTAEAVQVDIYNLRGQHVRSLLNESKAPGSYDLAWDAKDDDGRAVTNGIYLYKIRTGTYSSSKKMILLK